jgi:choline monooxygenase
LGLLPARVELLEGLVFVNLDPAAPPLAEVTAGLAERLRPYRLDQLVTFASGSHDGTQPANWKVVVENYLEGYHVPIAHPGLMRLLDYQRYTVETHGGWAWFDAPLREAPSANRLERIYQRLAKPMPGLSESDAKVWRYVLVYPNTTIDLYPDQVNIWQIRPAGVEHTTDSWACLRPRRSGSLTRLVQRVNHKLNAIVLDEDVDLVRGVQEGTRTRGYEPGPLSAREAGVAWFADRVRADLAGADER